MSMIGADVEQLAGLGRTLTNQVQTIETMMSTVGGALGNTLWRGPARDRFEADWTQRLREGAHQSQRRLPAPPGRTAPPARPSWPGSWAGSAVADDGQRSGN